MFTTARTVGWSNNISIFSLSLAHIPRPINTIIVLMIRVRNLGERGSLLGFSLLKFCSISRVRFCRFLSFRFCFVNNVACK